MNRPPAACPRARTGRSAATREQDAARRRGTPLTRTRLRAPPALDPGAARTTSSVLRRVGEPRVPSSRAKPAPQPTISASVLVRCEWPCESTAMASIRLVLPDALRPTTNCGPVGEVHLQLGVAAEVAQREVSRRGCRAGSGVRSRRTSGRRTHGHDHVHVLGVVHRLEHARRERPAELQRELIAAQVRSASVR